MKYETAFSMETSGIKYGEGITREVGYELSRLGARHVMIVTDPRLALSEAVYETMRSLEQHGVGAVLFDRVRVEPTDISFREAIRFAETGKFDGFVAVGGGSSMDTAKAANLYSTYPAEFLTYVNPPIGKGQPVPGPLKPLVAIPTTAGTGSEVTGVSIFDYTEMGAKTGIAHRSLRPSIGLLDPNNTRTLAKMVAACSGLDVLCHAIESYTALPYTQRPAPENPGLRPAYQGANPISDIWAAKSIEMVARNLVRVVQAEDDAEAREQMLLAAAFAGIGFGNAGVHLPHGMSYAVSGLVRDFIAADYPQDHPSVPHGMSVILNAPACFRFTGPANPERHLYVAGLLGAKVQRAKPEDAGEILANAIIEIMRQVGMPNGLGALGYTEADVDALVERTLPQHRVTKLSPRPADAANLRGLFLDSMTLW